MILNEAGRIRHFLYMGINFDKHSGKWWATYHFHPPFRYLLVELLETLHPCEEGGTLQRTLKGTQ